MQQPSCALCTRIGVECVYPSKRKIGRRSRNNIVRDRNSGEIHRACHAEQVPANVDNARFDAGSQAQNGPPQSYRESDPVFVPWLRNPTEGPSLSLTQASKEPLDETRSTAMNMRNSDVDGSTCSSLMETDALDSIPFRAFPEDYGQSIMAEYTIDMDWLDIPGVAAPSWLEWNSHLLSTQPMVTPLLNKSGANGPFTSGNDGNSSTNTHYSLLAQFGLSSNAASDLIRVFFTRIHCFLPLLHQPEFEAEFLHEDKKTFRDADTFAKETVLLLSSMFALAARFSDATLPELVPMQRGIQYARQACGLFEELMKQDQVPSLRCLQGSILLTYHDLALKPNFQTCLRVSACCRLAYGLSLHEIDKDSPAVGPSIPQSWTKKEEQRRAWWAIYQMDNFVSILACRPFNIDASRMDVFLPVADSVWFSNIPSPSLSLSAQGLDWQRLVENKIRDPYAWYLVSNILLRATHREFTTSNCSAYDVKILQASLHCLGLILPSLLRNPCESSPADGSDYTDKNWSICALILVQIAQIFTTVALGSAEMDKQNNISEPTQSNIGRKRQPLQQEKLFEECTQQISEHMRSVKMWSSDAITTASPLITCALVGPAAVFTTKPTPTLNDGKMLPTLRFLEWQILQLVLGRFAERWEIGQYMHDLLTDLITSPTGANSPSKVENPYIAVLLPEILQEA